MKKLFSSIFPKIKKFYIKNKIISILLVIVILFLMVFYIVFFIFGLVVISIIVAYIIKNDSKDTKIVNTLPDSGDIKIVNTYNTSPGSISLFRNIMYMLIK